MGKEKVRRTAAAATATEATAASLCFLVHPVPSIADESFLQTIFCGTVQRSAFLGFGRGRFAIAELTSATAAAAAVDALARVEAVEQRDGGRDDGTAPATASALEMLSSDDAALEHATLADLFTVPPPPSSTAATAAALTQQQQQQQSCSGDGDAAPDLSHLRHLFWRGQPVRVVVSGVNISDFYASGGVVPQHQPERRGGRGHRNTDNTHSNTKVDDAEPEQADAVDTTTAIATAGDVDAAPSTSSASARRETTKTQSFPKNCCQRCGSADHFTRHCDGSGAGSGDAAAAAAATAAATTPAVAAGGAPAKRTRHEGESATAAAASTPAAAATTARRTDAAAAAVTPTSTRPLASKTAPLVQRTSKDQCKFCGSDAHLSRHCPTKS
ncbi:hypothetical protein NESM_000403900 [Novymonas esmeraldas]|uniref:CCHC-type domain-containing protein n=1 Tax=Novymonas esmeraldas TaxID=1808958 RepID=A0AAW0EL10_9TRYP